MRNRRITALSFGSIAVLLLLITGCGVLLTPGGEKAWQFRRGYGRWMWQRPEEYFIISVGSYLKGAERIGEQWSVPKEEYEEKGWTPKENVLNQLAGCVAILRNAQMKLSDTPRTALDRHIQGYIALYQEVSGTAWGISRRSGPTTTVVKMTELRKAVVKDLVDLPKTSVRVRGPESPALGPYRTMPKSKAAREKIIGDTLADDEKKHSMSRPWRIEEMSKRKKTGRGRRR